jgi:Pyruvate/2-oxoacid:ferredoxin oxidoreductase gamma subunit
LAPLCLLVDCNDLDASDRSHDAAVNRLLDCGGFPVIVTDREPRAGRRRTVVSFEVRPPAPEEQRDLWKRELGEAADSLNGHLNQLVSQFNLSPPNVKAACADVAPLLRRKGGSYPEALGAALWDACRAQTRLPMDGLAQRVQTQATWEDLVLPAPQSEVLREIAIQVRHRFTVYEEWGFASRAGRGLGITVLFAGPSGTGKTLAAEVLANWLHVDLYRIDLSQVVNKYIGETEKNLRRVFDAAEQAGACLLFDEADALFGRRSEVKDSHDRYANIEVGYLLQRMEAYRGLAILTTNTKESLDTAFQRRLRFVIDFPFPDATLRAEIWRRIFPSTTPTRGLDVLKLARLDLAGGNIRNMALQAAFFAADDGVSVGMRHLLRAAGSECAKIGRPLTPAEVGGWV